MVFDKISNASQYYGLGRGIKVALNYLENLDFANVPAGQKVPLEGDAIFAVHPGYENKPTADCVAEGHRKYVDVMALVSGDEYVGYENIDDVELTTEYNAEGDYVLGKVAETTGFIPFKKGCFAIFFPQDGHVTGGRFKESGKVQKVVVKVSVDTL